MLVVIRYLYSLCFLLALPLVFLRLFCRSFRAPDYRKRWLERFGIFALPSTHKGGIWVHAVSLGESVAAIRVIKELQKKYSNRIITVTTTTPTGSAQVRKSLGDSVFHVYVPYDLPWTVNAFLKKVEPKLCVILETELWPNLLDQCYKRNIPVNIINARLSPKSVERYGMIKNYLQKEMLNKISMVAAQSELDKDNFFKLGMDPARLTVAGNIKFDINIVPEQYASGKKLYDSWGRKVWIAASTHDGEEIKILEAFAKVKKILPDALLILVPRHPERFNRVAELIDNKGYAFIRRSKDEACTKNIDILLVDTMGELGLFYQAADIAFIGGTLVPIGGHNMLEAAVAAVPVVTGPHLHNFKEISDKMLNAGAMVIIKNSEELAKVIINWFSNRVVANKIGNNAKNVVIENCGATQRIVKIIENSKGSL